MKIGILTFHNAVNYGARLQTYALSQSFKQLGCETEVIDYHCKEIEKTRCKIPIYKYRNPFKFIKNIDKEKKRILRIQKLDMFYTEKISLSEPIYNEKDLKNITSIYN